jgi:hypothetical protein
MFFTTYLEGGEKEFFFSPSIFFYLDKIRVSGKDAAFLSAKCCQSTGTTRNT